METNGKISREIIYVHCKATEHHTQGSHLLFLNNVSPLCPHRFVVQLSRSFGVWDFFYFTIAFAFEQQKKASTVAPLREGKGCLSAKHNHTYSSSTTAEGLTFKINPNLAHQQKLPSLHYVDINPRTRGHPWRYTLGKKLLQLPQSCNAPEPTSQHNHGHLHPRQQTQAPPAVSHKATQDQFGSSGCSTPAVKVTLGAPNRSEPHPCSGTDAESLCIRA